MSNIKILFLKYIGIGYLCDRYTYRYRIGIPIGIIVIGIYMFLNTEKEKILVILLSPGGLIFWNISRGELMYSSRYYYCYIRGNFYFLALDLEG